MMESLHLALSDPHALIQRAYDQSHSLDQDFPSLFSHIFADPSALSQVSTQSAPSLAGVKRKPGTDAQSRLFSMADPVAFGKDNGQFAACCRNAGSLPSNGAGHRLRWRSLQGSREQRRGVDVWQRGRGRSDGGESTYRIALMMSCRTEGISA